jgi:ribonuclease J
MKKKWGIINYNYFDYQLFQKNGDFMTPKNTSKNADANTPKTPAKNSGTQKATRTVRNSKVTSKTTDAKTTVRKPANRRPAQKRTAAVRIIPLGGLNEIGKNLYVFECSNDMFIVDCGLAFPDEDMLGVDLVIPDFTYLEQNKKKFRGVFLTHGHEDHIGALAYLLKNINIPVYGTRLTIGLIEGKLKEHGILQQCELNVVQPRQTVSMGCMAVEFIRVNHSIPDSCALAIHTPAGVIIHTGDFKVDYTPIGNDGVIDLARFGELGNKGVLALMSESTNAERPGYTTSERKVGDSFHKLFAAAKDKRIIVASFSSNIHRVQQIIDNAAATGRYIAISGRSMINVINKATEMGYIKVSQRMMIEMNEINNFPPEKIVIITTGSQGEPLSALSRMAGNDHRQVRINEHDLIIISATPIPGNEKLVGRVVNELMRSGAEVIYEKMYEVHVSGHACQDELKMMLSLTKPKFFIPIHGEYKHLMKHAQLAKTMGIPAENCFIIGNGEVLETDSISMKVTDTVTAGAILVDGSGVGDVGAVVLRDRKKLAEDGLITIVAAIERETGEVLSGPDIVSRGFVYVRESEELMSEARELMREVLEKSHSAANGTRSNSREWGVVKNNMRDRLSDLIYSKTKRNPMILPILMMVE